MEKIPNSNAPTLKLVNGPAGRDEDIEAAHTLVPTFGQTNSLAHLL
jgi:hypothetical protein